MTRGVRYTVQRPVRDTLLTLSPANDSGVLGSRSSVKQIVLHLFPKNRNLRLDPFLQDINSQDYI